MQFDWQVAQGATTRQMALLMLLASAGFALGLSSLMLTMIFQYQGNGGPAGPAGPIGLTGATGPEGPAGADGTDGNITAVENGLTLSTTDGVLRLGGALTEDTSLDQGGYNLTLGDASGPGSLIVGTGHLYMTQVPEDADSSAPSVLVLNSATTGLVEYTTVADLTNANAAAAVVYTNGLPSGSATRFSATYPAAVQDDSLKLLTTVTYCAATGDWYTSDGVTYAVAVYEATRSTVGNHASMYRATSQVLSTSSGTTMAWDGTNSVQGPSICPLTSAGAGVTSFTLAPGGIYSVRATISIITSGGNGFCTFGAYTDGTFVSGSTSSIYTWGFTSAVSSPTSNGELFSVIQVPTASVAGVALSIRTIACTGTTSGVNFLASSGTKVLVQQISIM